MSGGAPADAVAEAANGAIRLDKWLWQARFLKSRSLATKLCRSRKIRINGDVRAKPHQAIRPGDVLTFPLGPHIRVIEVVGVGARRGPAKEAQGLYKDLAPPERIRRAGKGAAAKAPSSGWRAPGAGRPTKSDRRAIDRLREGG